MTTEDRFFKKVNKKDGCWIWTGWLSKDGYGMLRIEGGKVRAHRFSYELHNGKMPKDLVIDHLCRIRACVNPEHLEAVSNRENVLRGEGLCAVNARKTHCKRGHEFTEENTFYIKKPHQQERWCKTCTREKDRERWHRRKVRVLK